jgi:hypothetical protein
MKTFASALTIVFLACAAPPEAPKQTATTTTTATTAAPAAKPLAITPTCVDAPNRLCPHDEAAADPSFLQFRDRMLEAVAQKDEAKLKTFIDPKIRTSFGDGGGIASFKPKWDELDSILKLGGAFRGADSFWAPYVYASWPEAVDAFTHVAAIRSGVPLHETASESAPVVTRVDWEILEVNPQKDAAWFHVRTSEGKKGWVVAADVRSPIGLRAGFSKQSGQWKMNALVAGD